jgi:AmmeMemoRadiSam system protein A
MDPTLTEAERQGLIGLARAAIARAIGAGTNQPAGPAAPLITRRAGAFVSLHIGNDLRGCVGYPGPDLSLADVVERCAVSAAIADPRFPSVSRAEWPRIAVEISVLGPIEPVADINEIEVGRHGLVAELGDRRGLFLPQVAIEWRWTREEFVEHTCKKAGLSSGAWRNGARLFKFEAEVFGG